VLVPSYSEPTVATYNAAASALWASLPGVVRVSQINAQALVTSAGVLHCIVMHLPAPRGGANPTAHVIAPAGGEVLTPGARFDVRWASDDDIGTTSVDVLLSRNAGASFDEVLAQGIADTGTFAWTVPDVLTVQARVRVVVRDAQGRAGGDASAGDFAIRGTQCTPANLGYGEGFGAGGSVPTLTSATPPALGSLWFTDLATARGAGVAFVLAGFAPMALPLAPGGQALVRPDVVWPVAVPGSGNLTLGVAVPNEALLCSLNVFWQAALADGALTAGLAMRLGR
jgi:hypothetical protein